MAYFEDWEPARREARAGIQHGVVFGRKRLSPKQTKDTTDIINAFVSKARADARKKKKKKEMDTDPGGQYLNPVGRSQ